MRDLFSAKYTTTDVSKIGIKRERLKEWTMKGYVRPSIKASGPGTKNLFSLLDLYQLKLFEKIIELGFFRKEAAFRTGVFGRAQQTFRESSESESHEQKDILGNGIQMMASANFIAFGGSRDENNPALFQMLYDKKDFNLDDYAKSPYVLIVNFKEIRDAVDSALG